MSDARFASLADAVEHGVFTTDAEGRVDFVNAAFADLVGFAPERLHGHRWLDAIHPEDLPRVRMALDEALATASPLREECRFLDPDGVPVWHDLRIAPGFEDGRLRWVGSLVRIGDWRGAIEELDRERHELARSLQQLGEGLREAQKMEALGKLAGGVAHDFNNLLTIIMACTEEMLDRCPEEDENRTPLVECRLAAKRASALTRDLLSFSRRHHREAKVLDLNQVVVEGERLLARLLGEDVKLHTSLASDLGPTVIDPNQWTSVLVNLAVNARHAMPDGGELQIVTRNVVAHGDGALPRGRYAMLQVSDTGHGFDAATAARLFDPFFTTKAVGHGTGLGLTVVQNVVEESGGFIVATSEPGRGTSFTIHVPVVENDSTPKLRSLPPRAVRGTETVLLVEDEERIREAMRRVLEAHGYSVLSAADAEEAIRFLRDEERHVDIMVTDVVLPRMNGKSLADMVRQSHPSMRVLYTSGYMDDAIARRGVERSEVAFLAKPYTARQLIGRMRELLDEGLPAVRLESGEQPIRADR